MFAPYAIDYELVQLYVWGLLALLCCCGAAAALLIAWRGKVAGMLVGGVVLGGGLATLVSMLALVPRYWWLSVPPICLGVQTLRMWRRPPASAASMSVTLRTAALAVLGLALMLAGFSEVRRRVARERRTAGQLEALDADVVHAFDGVVKAVMLRNVSDARIRRAAPLLSQLRGLRELGLDGSKVRSETLAFLPQLRGLEVLGLQNCRSVDSAALPYIAQLPRLKQLDLIRTAVGDARLQELAALASIERLYLNGSGVTAAAAQRLAAQLHEAEVSY